MLKVVSDFLGLGVIALRDWCDVREYRPWNWKSCLRNIRRDVRYNRVNQHQKKADRESKHASKFVQTKKKLHWQKMTYSFNVWQLALVISSFLSTSIISHTDAGKVNSLFVWKFSTSSFTRSQVMFFAKLFLKILYCCF